MTNKNRKTDNFQREANWKDRHKSLIGKSVNRYDYHAKRMRAMRFVTNHTQKIHEKREVKVNTLISFRD